MMNRSASWPLLREHVSFAVSWRISTALGLCRTLTTMSTFSKNVCQQA